MQQVDTPQPPAARHTAALVRARVEQEGERLWTYDDFPGLPPTALAQALSRLARGGELERLSRGTYYRSRPTVFGQSRPNPAAVQRIVARRASLFPAGLSAAALLGFTTQTARQAELATSSRSLPRKLVGADVVVHTRRPRAWDQLSSTQAALLDFLRRGGAMSELGPEATVQKTVALLTVSGYFDGLLAVALTEPPRVRAMLGALGEARGLSHAVLHSLKCSLNPMSRFDFGVFSILPTAQAWQAKRRH